MLVQRMVMPVSGAVSWTVLDDDGGPVEPVEQYLAYLACLERSPNTLRAYATSLRLWLEFLGQVGVAGRRRAWRTWPGSCRGCGPRPTT